MDDSYKSEFEFLDLEGLNAQSRDEITAILKPTVNNDGLNLPWDRGVIEYHVVPEEHIETQEMPKIWQQYEMEGNMIKYEAHQTNATSSVFVTVPSPIQYSQQMMAPMYSEWAPNMYINSIPGDPNVHQYMSGVAYPTTMYPTNNETQEMQPMREGGRRGRGRTNKSYNRNINHQHPAAGQPIYFPSPQIYTPQMAQQTHRVDYIQYQQSPTTTNPKYNRPSQNLLPQTNGETTKSTNYKPYDKQGQNVNITKPSIHQALEDDNNSPQTNIVTTVIVNNSNIESSNNDVDENLTATNNSNNKFGFKIEQHIVSTINDNYKGVEKNDIPIKSSVNIKSSIEVKQNGNENTESDDSSSHIKIPIASTTSKSVAIITEDESLQIKEVKEIPTLEYTTDISEVPVNSSLVAIAGSKSWASLLKQNTDSYPPGPNKPTAFIAPNNAISLNNNQTKLLLSEKAHSTLKSHDNKNADGQQRDNSAEQNRSTHNEVPQKHIDDPTSYRMGEYLLSYQTEKHTVSLQPRGLTNRSNYCYINSILQALLACPPFYNLFMSMPYSKNPSRHSPSPLLDNMIKFVREFAPLSEGARLPRKDRAQKRNEDTIIDIQSGVPFEPSYIYTILKNSSSPGVFSVEGRQEDAEEFLSCLLNGLSDEMLELMKLASSNDQKAPDFADANANFSQSGGEDEWKVMGPKNKGSITRSTDCGRTPLSDIFRGQLRSRVSRAGEDSTDYVQPFFTLQLDIEKAESVKTALEILVGKDPLEGMTCSKTKQQIEAWKQVTLEKLPVILILHLKWFDYKPDGCTKILKSVEFPVDLKIDNKLMSNNKSKANQKQRQYKLFAVTYHDGKEATKGHYVTDAFHVGYGGWVRYDDSSLRGVSEANVLNPQPPRVPYLLYYRRCDTIGNNQSNNTVKAQ
ncbi:ubiquitin carboxyl-terminal hydrolase 10-like isoform X2 [Phymastichus coffea]|uniref:ubiquitin carboxyl-terminal hydrolase 10-like isoform X2 n=1 Tax=Phymastichus coffea TaxID=108790 RepID=UPI00273ADDD1|nr:ubiquitin carboxyl-terminal hydrolase 10-like isoform X2 [Phymastichus coffea]